MTSSSPRAPRQPTQAMFILSRKATVEQNAKVLSELWEGSDVSKW